MRKVHWPRRLVVLSKPGFGLSRRVTRPLPAHYPPQNALNLRGASAFLCAGLPPPASGSTGPSRACPESTVWRHTCCSDHARRRAPRSSSLEMPNSVSVVADPQRDHCELPRTSSTAVRSSRCKRLKSGASNFEEGLPVWARQTSGGQRKQRQEPCTTYVHPSLQ